jgi:AraC-like DNA-binding protein
MLPLPVFCLLVSQIRHEPIAPTHVESRTAGDVIDRHQHDNHQLIYVSTGVLAIQTERGTWVASRDRAVWIPAGTWHEHRFYGGSLFHTVGFPVHDAPLPDTSPTVLAVSGLIRELLIACTEPHLPPTETRRIRAVLHDRLRRAHVRPLSLPTARDPRLAHACRLVTADLTRPRSVDWLARSVGTSERTLTRLYRTEFGTTYPQWRTHTRVFNALIQLAEGATVTETAQRCGWATTSAFIDTFAHTMGQTPGAYRTAAAPAQPI